MDAFGERSKHKNRSLAVCGFHLAAAGPTPTPHAKVHHDSINTHLTCDQVLFILEG